MAYTEIIKLIVSSSVLAGIIGGIFTLVKSKVDYNNEFYKTLLRKRVDAFDMIEEVLYCFSTAIIDEDDNRFYHMIFFEGENPLETRYIELMTKLSKQNIWISEAVRDELCALNRYIIENSINFNSIEDGKRHYHQLGEFRDNILKVCRQDIRSLHKFSTAFNSNSSDKLIELTVKRPVKKSV